MRRTTTLFAALLAIILGSFATDSYAQGVQTGSLRGTVTDQQSLPVPGVTVTIQSPALQGVRSSVTAGDGSYSFVRLPPGRYEMTFEITSFAPVKRTTDVLLGLSVEQNVTLTAAGRTEEVQVVAASPAPIVNPTVGANYKHEEIQSLATPRSLQGISQLAPGVTENTPNAGQLAINGGFAFDNVFMLNGVDVNDNLFGSPQNLFIEDAIEETQVLTSGITAEYGRFTGGVVNAVTKSGGNTFQRELADELREPVLDEDHAARALRGAGRDRADDLPAGGGAARPAAVHPRSHAGRADRARQTVVLRRDAALGDHRRHAASPDEHCERARHRQQARRDQVHRHGRVEPHVPGRLSEQRHHADQPADASRSRSTRFGDRQPHAAELVWLRQLPRDPEEQPAGRSAVLAAQVPVQGLRRDRQPTIVDSPFITLTQTLGHYNAQYFDATDPENRNNQQLTGNLTYFLNGERSGRHEIKVGYEWFRSQRTGGNSQSSTGYVFDADYATDAGGQSHLRRAGIPDPRVRRRAIR